MPRRLSVTFSRTAKAIGSNMRVVAMLEIHMLRQPAAAMNPMTSRRPLVPPKSETIVSAIRRWAPLRSMAWESISPPMSSRMSLSP